ncbi:uncharacterized protein LOC143895897 isoform X4 [Temnothorax americanus]|uniref:uncharacterized protein LOC143895897 isoform X4 n=1 Tax=Temnothorax americanus TaxID=1964332 RepID=UPI004067C57B
MKSTERTDFRTMRRRCAFGSVRYNVSRKVDGIVGREHRGTKGDCRVPRSVRAVVSSDEVKEISLRIQRIVKKSAETAEKHEGIGRFDRVSNDRAFDHPSRWSRGKRFERWRNGRSSGQ